MERWGLYAESGQTLIFSNFRNFQNFRNFSKFQNFQKFSKKIQKFRKISKIFKIVGRGAVQKLGERVVLGKSCPLRILLQNMASIQPRTSPCIFKIFENFKNLNFQKFSKFSKIFENRWTRSGAKAGGTGRSRQELPVAYFVAKFVLHPAENEPRQDCKFSANFRKFRRRCRLLRRPFRKFFDAGRCKSWGCG